jgi:hypothetical protein
LKRQFDPAGIFNPGRLGAASVPSHANQSLA